MSISAISSDSNYLSQALKKTANYDKMQANVPSMKKTPNQDGDL